MKHVMLKAGALALCLIASQAWATNWLKVAEKAAQSLEDRSATVQHNGTIEYAFSPREGGEKLVLKVIGSARTEIRVMAYALTSAPLVEALIDARRRGVDVAVVADFEQNVTKDNKGIARAALSALVNAGCRVRTISVYQIHHDKVIVADRESVETGSFNFTSSAASRNSENVMVVWKNPDLARGYLAHWQDRFSKGDDYRTNY